MKLLPLGVAILLFACTPALKTDKLAESLGDLTPPMAKIIPRQLEKHGDVRTDDYYWLRERENPEVIAYLEAENKYTQQMMAHTEKLQAKLFNEIKGRIKQDDSSVPYKKDDYYYYTRYEDGKEYPIYCRKKESLENPEEIMLDVNVLAEGHDFFSVWGVVVSSGQDLLAFGADTVGRRIYTIHFKNLTTGAMIEEVIPSVTGMSAWANDNKTLFYVKQDPSTLRWYQIYRHELGTDPAGDELVFQEDDETFSCYVFKTKSKRFIMIASYQTLSSEYRYIDADRPLDEFVVLQERQRDHEYDVDHLGDKFYVRTNHEAQNFRLMETPVTATGMANWTELVPHRDDVLLSNFELFQDHLVLQERKEGLVHIRTINWDGSGEHYLDFGEPAYLAYIGDNPIQDTQILRYGYTSMTTPNSTYDYDMVTHEKTLMKQDEVLGGFDSGDYETERLYAAARDGIQVPISIVYRKGIKKDGSNPLMLYGYGSYGSSENATFSASRVSLLDRGFVYAIAHIRGGQEMGRWWYEDGKLLKKKNTFTDFIDCGEYLVEEGYTSPERLFAQGGSAGGLLVGAVMNMRPDLFKGIVTRVPWVDVVTTMLDEDIPLTTSEYDEWGNPNEKEYYDYMLSYSPYDQVTARDYPNLLVTTSLHDSQVQYWEPAKWVAKLRALKTDNNRLLLKTDMEAGHGGASGRYKRYRDTTFYYAFLLDLAGIKE
ncbi:MAG: S9 family peptidase [Fidelibacterota bacterium]|nr:MAG: S9 family peptidase [Candidatus Neomarinimicrobiota bacterium]